jgi:hypothetical protein
MNKKILVLILTTITAGSMVQAERDHDPFLAEAVEMPGNVVGSFFGGGYVSKSRRAKEESTSMSEEDIKNDLKEYKRKKSAHQRALKHVENKTDQLSVAEANRHRGAISKLEAMIENLERKLKNMF